MKWPSSWNLSPPDRHGYVSFPNPNPDEALSHILEDPNTYESSDVQFSTSFGDAYNFQHTFAVLKPQICGLNVKEDTRCDDAKNLLFGLSTSVGQICSISEAVRPQDLITGTYSSEPVSTNQPSVY